jgi:putative transposase
MKKRFTEEQIVSILREGESGTATAKDVCRKHGIAEHTFYRWRRKYGGMDVPDARRLKQLEAENAKLKKMLAEQLLLNDGLKEIAKGKF